MALRSFREDRRRANLDALTAPKPTPVAKPQPVVDTKPAEKVVTKTKMEKTDVSKLF